MRFIIIFNLLTFVLPMLTGCSKSGGSWQHYRLSAFSEARDRGMTIYLHFHEDGNASSEQQKKLLEEIIQNEKFKKVGAYRVSWNSEKALQKALSVTAPATLIVLKGSTELGRAIGATDERLLERLLSQAL